MSEPFVPKAPPDYDTTRLMIIPHSLKGPHLRRLIALTPTKLVFDGYFRIEPKMLPVERIICIMGRKREYHIRIKGLRKGGDTSTYWYDDDVGENICLMPTEIIEMDIEILSGRFDGPTFSETVKAILAHEESEEFEKRNYELRRAREDAEWKAGIEKFNATFTADFLRDKE